jgi:hypothetical protein
VLEPRQGGEPAAHLHLEEGRRSFARRARPMSFESPGSAMAYGVRTPMFLARFDSKRHAPACGRVARCSGSPGVMRSRESPPESVVEGMAPHPKRMDPLTRNVRVGASLARKGPRVERFGVFSERGIQSANSTMTWFIQVGKPAHWATRVFRETGVWVA